MTGLTIRAAREEDEDVVVALWRASNLVVSHNDPNADFRLALGRINSDVLVATSADGTIVGAVIVGHDGHRGWIYYLATDPDQRRRGHGRALVQEAEAWVRQRGIPKLQLLVRETNLQVIPFYEALGFETAPFVLVQKWLTK